MHKIVIWFSVAVLFSLPALADEGRGHREEHGRGHSKPYEKHLPSHGPRWSHNYWPRPLVYYYPVRPVAIHRSNSVVFDQIQQIIFRSNRDPYQNQFGDYCREYRTLIYADGRIQTGFGAACMQPDGDWRIFK